MIITVAENSRAGMSYKTAEKLCNRQCEIYSRVCGYFRPVCNWNKGKKAEFAARKKFIVEHCKK